MCECIILLCLLEEKDLSWNCILCLTMSYVCKEINDISVLGLCTNIGLHIPGSVFWRGDSSYLQDFWNTYNVLAVPDLTKDGVSDLILAHGGDARFPPQVSSQRTITLAHRHRLRQIPSMLRIYYSRGCADTCVTLLLHIHDIYIYI